jgi:ADP-ribose pyrophosphatase YjhB (NUDIX family)
MLHAPQSAPSGSVVDQPRSHPLFPAATRFCTHCGSLLARRIPLDDTRMRFVCARCEHVHYENPRILVSCFVTCGQGVLLCRRALQPGYGLWAPPAGYLEEGESLEQAAARETLEETGVVVDPRRVALHGVSTLTALRQVYVNFRTQVAIRGCAPGREALDAGYFDALSVPWGSLTYPQIAIDLRVFLNELATGQFGVHLNSVP